MIESKSFDGKMTEMFNKHGVFFAFSDKQYNEAAVTGVKYTQLGSGAIVPVSNANDFVEEFNTAAQDHAAYELKKYGKEHIIDYELGNHEYQLTGDISETLSALKNYGLTEDDVKKVIPKFMQKCIDNDWF